MKRLLLISIGAALAALGASCGLVGDDCDSEGHITSASMLRDRMQCSEVHDMLPIFAEGKESFEILEFPNLVTIKGSLNLSLFPNVTEVHFPKLESINGPNGDAGLVIKDMPSLEVISLGALRKVVVYDSTPRTVEFSSNPRLTTINMDSLEIASEIYLAYLDVLREISLPAINNPSDVGIGMRVLSNFRLESVDLGASTSIAAIRFQDNPTLMSITGGSPSDVSGLVLADLPFLSEFDVPVTSVDGALTVERVGLGVLELDELVDAPLIEIRENSSMTSISMASLESSTTFIHVQDNETLSSLNFPALAVADVLRFIQNFMLSDCEIYGLVDQVTERQGNSPSLEIRFNLEDECAPN